MELDWRLFPPELLQLISEKLPSIHDYVRFRAVCPAWRSAASPRPLRLPQQLPWLILPRGTFLDTEEATLESSLCVYDLSQSKTHTLNLPEIHGKRICGSSHGWLVLEKDRQVWLLNPISRDQISLPSLSAQPNFFLQGINPKDDDATNWRAHSWIMKAILSSNPRLDPNCLVMALFSGPWKTGFCRIEDAFWTILTLREKETWSDVKELRSSYCFFFGGNYHCISLPLASLQLHGWEGTCMCYTSPQFEDRTDDADWYSCSIKLYKLNDQTVTTLASHLGFFRWYKYQHTSRRLYFLWFTPSLC